MKESDLLGKTDADEALRQAGQNKNDLNAVVTLYGVAVYLEHIGRKEWAAGAVAALLERQSVWPCISYLAAWNDRQQNH